MKLVINKCCGEFSLSEKGVRRYAELKGLPLYVEQDPRFSIIKTYWTVPPEKRPEESDGKWASWTTEERKAHNEAWEKATISNRDIPRDDKLLVQLVEELGMDANGDCADLKIVEVPDGTEWTIEEYDGREWVAETHQTWS